MVAVIALALALRLIFADTPISADAQYPLVWGREALRGDFPDYSGLSAPHPLTNLIELPLALLGSHAEGAVSALSSLLLAGTAVVVFWLARATLGAVAGVAAALLILTRPAIVTPGLIQLSDTLSVVLCLGALLILVRRPGATWLPLALLGLAGLVRPEPWLYAAVLGLVRLRQGDSAPPFVPLALAVAAAPLIWVAADLVVTGDPVYSFFAAGGGGHGGGAPSSAQTANAIAALPKRLEETVGKAELLAGVVGAALVAWRLGRTSPLLLVALALPLGAALAEAIAGLPIVGRYLFLPVALLLIVGAAPATSRRLVPPKGRSRAVYALLAIPAAALLVAYLPARVNALQDNRVALGIQDRAREDARALLKAHPPPASCGPIAVPSRELIPAVRWWLDRGPGSVVVSQLDRPEVGTYLVPESTRVRRVFFVEGSSPRDDPRQRLTGAPRGFRRVAGDRSWSLWQRCRVG